MKPKDTAALLQLLYLVTLVAGGMALVALTPTRDLGVIGYVGGGVLAFAGGSLLLGRLRGVGVVPFTCPSCGHEQTLELERLEGGRPAPCGDCGHYVHQRNGQVIAVDLDEVVAVPAFEAPLPEGSFAWPEGCALCGCTPCDREEVEGVSEYGRGRVAHSIRVPVCVHHRGAEAVELGRGYHEPGANGFALRFRSYAVARRFVTMNQREPRASSELELAAEE